jgi:hypothetical protein
MKFGNDQSRDFRSIACFFGGVLFRLGSLLFALFILTSTGYSFADDKARGLIESHLSSVGPPEARSAIKNQQLEGVARYSIVQGGAGSLRGAASLISEGKKIALSIEFGHNEYPAEKIAFDGKDVFAEDIKPGQRSPLGQFLHDYDEISREGLVGGVLSTAWPLLTPEKMKARLVYGGVKKLNGRELILLRYFMRRGGGDIQVRLYFDPKSYRHVASWYRVVVQPLIADDPMESTRRFESRYEVEEWFDRFREIKGVKLPTRWTIRFTADSDSGAYVGEWAMSFNRFVHNTALEKNAFRPY